jgi:CDGSH-type Zn-finger protein
VSETPKTPTQQRIRILPDGPYLVVGAVPLTERYPAESRHGEPLAWDPGGAPEEMVAPRATYALCRCGQSANKPFCDGTHARIGFDGTVTAELESGAGHRRTLVGTGIVMTDAPELCVHAGFCGTRLTNAWEMMARTGDPEVRAWRR